jgi:methionyl-tRNA formyltransferase
MIGSTVMLLDDGIDSGNIIASARTPLNGRESLLELHIKVIDHMIFVLKLLFILPIW